MIKKKNEKPNCSKFSSIGHFLGIRLREGGFINKSLFALGNVINKLSEGERYTTLYYTELHVQYLQSDCRSQQ